jgi:hypothetical protein
MFLCASIREKDASEKRYWIADRCVVGGRVVERLVPYPPTFSAFA